MKGDLRFVVPALAGSSFIPPAVSFRLKAVLQTSRDDRCNILASEG